jgi:hypothetical protein
VSYTFCFSWRARANLSEVEQRWANGDGKGEGELVVESARLQPRAAAQHILGTTDYVYKIKYGLVHNASPGTECSMHVLYGIVYTWYRVLRERTKPMACTIYTQCICTSTMHVVSIIAHAP